MGTIMSNIDFFILKLKKIFKESVERIPTYVKRLKVAELKEEDMQWFKKIKLQMSHLNQNSRCSNLSH